MRCGARVWMVWLVACGTERAPVPVPAEASLAVTDANGAPTSVLDVATPVGTRRASRIVVTNEGDLASGPIVLAVDGARDFAIDAEQTTCAGRALAGGESCEVVVRYFPVSAGDHTARLGIASAPGGSHEVVLGGSAVVPALHWSPGLASLGTLETAVETTHEIVLVNDGGGEVVIGPVTASGDAAFSIASTTCGTTLGAGAQCEVVVAVTPDALGALAGELGVTSEGTEYAVPLEARGARRVTIVRTGTETGNLVSSPFGISCGGRCTSLFESELTLSATALFGARVGGWSIPGCGTEATCVVPADPSPVTVVVQFDPEVASPVSITFTGGGSGEVALFDRETSALLATCSSDCTLLVRTGRVVRFVASSPGASYGGMSGACSTPSGECQRTVPVAGLALGVQFTNVPGSAWVRLLPGPDHFHTAAFDAAEHLILGSESSVVKLAPDGSTVWSASHVVKTLATGPDNTIYLALGNGIRKLAPDGSELWTRTHGLGTCAVDPSFTSSLSVGSDGSAVVQGATGIARFDADGTSMWSVPLANTGRCGVAIDRITGNVYVLTEDPDEAEATDVLELAAVDGSELARIVDATMQHDARIAPAANGGFVVCSSGHGIVHLRNGGLVDVEVPNATPSGCTAVGTGVGWAYATSQLFPEDWRLHHTGLNGFVHTRLAFATSEQRYGSAPRAIAGSASGRLAVAGTYFGPGQHRAWVQAFGP